MIRPAIILVVAFGLGATAGGRGQTPQGPPPSQTAIGTGAIAGQVVDGRSGSPIPNAVVAAGGRSVPVPRVLADASGRFMIPNLPAGDFLVSASQPGYAGDAVGVGRAQQSTHSVTLADGQRVGDLTLRLWKLGVITGTVTSDASEPLVGLDVHAWRRSLLGGRWIWVPAASAPTDDRGVYRLSGLRPGDYVVLARPAADPDTSLLLSVLSASPEIGLDILAAAMTTPRKGPVADATVRSYATTFFPASPVAARATVIPLDAGDERLNVNLRLTPQRLVRVSGTVTAGPAPLEGLTVRLVPSDTDGTPAPIEAASTACESDGRFEFPSVPPGRYIVSVLDVPIGQPGAQSPPPPQQQPARTTGPTWWASVPVVVGTSDISNLGVPLHQGVTVGGTIASASDSPWPRDLARQMTLRLDRVDTPLSGSPGSWTVSVDAGGMFRSVGVPPGRYLLRVSNPPRGWNPASAAVAGRDMLDEPLTVGTADVTVALTLTDRPLPRVSGVVRDDSGPVAADASVAIFPANPPLWSDAGPGARRLRLVRPDRSGHYAIGGLPPGDYFVVALRDDLPADWPDPKRLTALATRASRVSIVDPSQTLDLKVSVR